MNRPFPRVRSFLSLPIIVAVIGISASLWERPQSAQVKTPARGLPEKFAVSDGATRLIRDPGTRIRVVRVEDESDRENAASNGTVLEDHGSFVLVADRAGTAVPKADSRTLETTINLPGRSFDPLKESEPETVAPTANRAAITEGYYIVQFGVLATDELLESLQGAGVEVIQYIPHQAFFVYGNGDQIASAAGHSRVRWTGRYRAEQKLSSTLREQLRAHKTKRPPQKGISKIESASKTTAIFDVAVFG